MKSFLRLITEAEEKDFIKDYAKRVFGISEDDPEVSWIRSMFADPVRTLPYYKDWLEDKGDDRYIIGNYLLGLAMPNLPNETIKKALKDMSVLLKATGKDLLSKIIYDSKFPNINEWLRRNKIVIKRILLSEDIYLTPEILQGILPTGNGIDGTWEIENLPGVWQASNYYHAMDEGGMYAGYVHFTVTIPKTNPYDFEITLDQTEVDELEEREVYLGDLNDFLSYEIRHSLDNHWKVSKWEHI